MTSLDAKQELRSLIPRERATLSQKTDTDCDTENIMGKEEAWVGKEEGPPGFASDIITGSLCIDVREDKKKSTDWLTVAQGEEPLASSDDEDEPSTT